MEYEVVAPGEQSYVTEAPVGTPMADAQDIDENLDARFKQATTAEVAIGCTMAVIIFIVLGVMFCRRSSYISDRMLRLRPTNSENNLKVRNYDAIDATREEKKRKRLSAMSSFSSFANLFPRSKSDGDVKKTNGPSSNMLSIPSNSGTASPGITRSVQHGNIPFTLPPMMVAKSSSAGSGFVERVQPYHPRSFSENDMPLSSIPRLSECASDQAISEEIFSDAENPLTPEFDNSMEVIRANSRGRFRNSLLGQIQPELYKYSEHEEHDLPPSQFGRVWFTLVYDAAVEALTVKVIKVRQLSGRGSNVPHDCFVKLFLLPDERMSQQTKVKRRTNNPRFNETFVFQASESDIKDRTLRLSVYDVDKRKVARHLLGHALVTLKDVDLLSQSEDVMWRDLDERAHPGDSGATLGEVNVSLSYLPSLDRLTVVILRARNLREIDLEETGVYVKVTLKHGHQVIKAKKTAMKRGECDPHYNESFSFRVTSKDIESSCLAINIITLGYHTGLRHFTTSFKNLVSTGKPNNEHKYGRVVVGSFMFCRGEQLLHWQEMLAQPRKAIAKWHPLSEIAVND